VAAATVVAVVSTAAAATVGTAEVAGAGFAEAPGTAQPEVRAEIAGAFTVIARDRHPSYTCHGAQKEVPEAGALHVQRRTGRAGRGEHRAIVEHRITVQVTAHGDIERPAGAVNDVGTQAQIAPFLGSRNRTADENAVTRIVTRASVVRRNIVRIGGIAGG